MLTSLALHSAIEGLYAAFAAYPFRPVLPTRCDCCPDLDLSSLAHRPLRTLSSSDLVDVYHLVSSNAGDSRDLRYFLPRFLELLAIDPDAILSPLVLADRLKEAGMTDWPAAERLALQRYLRFAPETVAAGRLSDLLLPSLSDSLRQHSGA